LNFKPQDLKHLKDMPSSFFIGSGIAIAGAFLAVGWAITSMAGCEAEMQKHRYEYLEKSSESFWSKD
jgi:hypothetical protein